MTSNVVLRGVDTACRAQAVTVGIVTRRAEEGTRYEGPPSQRRHLLPILCQFCGAGESLAVSKRADRRSLNAVA